MSLHDSSYPAPFFFAWLDRSAVTPAPLPNDTFRYAALQYEPLRAFIIVSFYGCRKLKIRSTALKKQKGDFCWRVHARAHGPSNTFFSFQTSKTLLAPEPMASAESNAEVFATS